MGYRLAHPGDSAFGYAWKGAGLAAGSDGGAQ